MLGIVPTFSDLSFYTTAAGQDKRYKSVINLFKEEFDTEPEFLARSPGRVNLMGDHIDYNKFSVLPMAIDADVIAAVGCSDDTEVVLVNTDKSFQSEVFELPANGAVIEIDKAKHTWGNYFKCAMIVAHHYILEKFPDYVDGGKKPLRGMKLAFNGTVPTGGGLSSSAAFCVTSTLAILRANGVKSISKEELTRITVVSEHYVGVNTGGMDQCASIYGEKGKTLLVQFKPKLVGIPFDAPLIKPHEMVFLISNSLVKANKHETAPRDYNLRVVEMAISAEMYAKHFGLKLDKDSNLSTGSMRDFMDKYFEVYLKADAWDGSDIKIGEKRLNEMLAITEKLFNEKEKEGFTTSEAAEKIGISVEEFTETFLSKFPVKYEKLKIYQRSKHVYAEALRVLEVLSLFQSHSTAADGDKFLREFGRILNESHRSLDIYNGSVTPELNELCDISTSNGAYGARVTGAGFGGSVVHMTTVDKLPNVIKALKEQYYNKRLPDLSEAELLEALVVSKPAAGSCYVELATS